MKTLKIVGIVVVIIAVGFSVVAIAGNVQKEKQHDGKEGWFEFLSKDTFAPKMIMEHLKERLNLTEEQEAQILPILEEAMQKRIETFRQFKGEMGQDWQNIEAEHQAMWQETEKQLAEILTEEQMQEARKIHDEHVGKFQGMKQRFANRRHKQGKFRELLGELNLSAEQKGELFAIVMKNRDNRKNAIESVQEIRSQFSNVVLDILNEDFDEEKVRQTYRESTAKMEDFVIAGAKMLAEMKTVLTPEQLEQLQKRLPELLEESHGSFHSRHSMLKSWQ